jgi:hypothetical protein
LYTFFFSILFNLHLLSPTSLLLSTFSSVSQLNTFWFRISKQHKFIYIRIATANQYLGGGGTSHYFIRCSVYVWRWQQRTQVIMLCNKRVVAFANKIH